jgi:murein DD-endopeptidase MepM/ murein hydrolase activator NlpD
MPAEMRIAKNSLRPVAIVIICLYAGLLAPAARATDLPHCTPGVTMDLTAQQTTQGSVLLVQVRSTAPIQDISGKWNDRPLYFWSDKDSATSTDPGAKTASTKPPSSKIVKTVDHRQALLGVDLEKPAGSYPLSIEVLLSDASHAQCSANLTVRAGKFASERLKVENKFVEPDPEQTKRIAEEQKKLRELFDHVTQDRLWQGPFRIPLTGVTTGSNFGKRRILNGQPRPPHTGADFPATTGIPVRATQTGKVVLAEELYFSGNTVIVDHGLGVYSLYGHLSAIDVAVGDAVSTASILGKVGATGRVTGPHLHWGLTVNKARVDPVQLVHLYEAPRRASSPRRYRNR